MAVAATGCAAMAATAFVAPSGHQAREVQAPVKQLRSTTASGSSSSLPLGVIGTALGCSAVAASARRSQTRNLRTETRAFENELGVQAPVGFWDPAGFTSDGDKTEFFRRRCVELKHGRVSMLACIGYIVPELAGRWPGYLSPSSKIAFADIPNGLAAVTKVPGVGWFQATVFCGLCELWISWQPGDNEFENGEAGALRTRFYGGDFFNYRYGSLGIPGYLGGQKLEDPELRKKKLSAELANGRLAMMAIIGMFFQDGLTGSAWGDWSNYTDSPLRAFENETGVQAPLGFWDPLGFTKDGDVQEFQRRREVELKNGRVAMFATIGYIVPEYYRLPGMLSPSADIRFEDVPNGIQALVKAPAEGWFQWILFCGGYEILVNKAVDPADPGNYGKGKFGIGNAVLGYRAESIADPEARKRGLNSELANGRLAMMAIIGMFFQDGLTGSAWGDWANYTDSPLRAFENELGVQAPAGFWDPLGFTKSGDAAAFRRRRYVELKHGRVSMLACLGYITAEYYRFPGELSPSTNLQFTDVPNGLNAFSKVPFSGWAQMIAFAGTVELFQYVDDPTRPPGDFENAGLLGIPNGFVKASDDQREKKLAAELANGRLAMMAIIGMFFQDGLTGSAWGDWSNYTDSPLR